VKSLLGRRPSPALVISLIALFVSLSGVSYGVATGFIDSREIKNNEVRSLDIRNNEIRTRDLRNNEIRGIDIRNSTIQSRDIGLNQVTGLDVREDTLQKVPSALVADTATRATSAAAADTAGSAGSVGGVTLRRISYAGEQGSGLVDIVDIGGIKLQARCVAGGPFLEVQATTTVANSELWSEFGSFTQGEADFDPGETRLVVDNPAADSFGDLAFVAPDGRVVTVAARTREQANAVQGTTNDCGFFGIAQAG
jgi:hypothetical protein